MRRRGTINVWRSPSIASAGVHSTDISFSRSSMVSLAASSGQIWSKHMQGRWAIALAGFTRPALLCLLIFGNMNPIEIVTAHVAGAGRNQAVKPSVTQTNFLGKANLIKRGRACLTLSSALLHRDPPPKRLAYLLLRPRWRCDPRE